MKTNLLLFVSFLFLDLTVCAHEPAPPATEESTHVLPTDEKEWLEVAYQLLLKANEQKDLEISHLRETHILRNTQLTHYRTITCIGIIVVLLLLLVILLKRQHRKTQVAKLQYAAEEKERQFLSFQKDTERRLTRKYIEGLESERHRLAVELHDDVCHRLLALEMKASAGPIGPETAGRLQILADIRNRVRNISHELMPPVFQYTTLDEMLNDHLRHLELPETMEVAYTSTEGVAWNNISDEVGFEFYRIVQEAVSNAIKHSQAKLLQVKLRLKDNRLSFSVEDNGKGFDPDKKTGGIGLRSIHQRAETINATLRIASQPGTGTRVEAEVTL